MVGVLAVVVVWVLVCMRLECWLEGLWSGWWCAGGWSVGWRQVVASFVVLPGEMP